jgi:hypothetical protein
VCVQMHPISASRFISCKWPRSHQMPSRVCHVLRQRYTEYRLCGPVERVRHLNHAHGGTAAHALSTGIIVFRARRRDSDPRCPVPGMGPREGDTMTSRPAGPALCGRTRGFCRTRARMHTDTLARKINMPCLRVSALPIHTSSTRNRLALRRCRIAQHRIPSRVRLFVQSSNRCTRCGSGPWSC